MEEKPKRHRKTPEEKLAELQANVSKWSEKKKAADRELDAYRKQLSRKKEKEEIAQYISAIKKFKKHSPKLFDQFDLDNLSYAAFLYLVLKKAHKYNAIFIDDQGNIKIDLNSSVLTEQEKNNLRIIAE